jgi:hypothetical protein
MADKHLNNIPENLHESLTNIAKNKGITLNDFLKPHLREVAQKYAKLINEENQQRKKQIALRGINDTISWQLNNVSNNLGVGITELLKIEFYLLAAGYPEHMKRKPREY